MALKNRLSCFFMVALLFSVMGSPAAAQEVPGGYSMPGLFPLYSAPPVEFRDNRIMIVIFKTTPEVLRELVPQPLLPNPLSLMFVYIGSLNIKNAVTGRFNYLEAGIAIPVVYPSTMATGNYAVCLYLNEAIPIAGGREVWGWPKKDGKLTFAEKDGEIMGRVERFGTGLMSVSGKRLKKVEPVPPQPQLPWILQKIIPSARKNAPPDIWQLVSTLNVNAVTSELWDCTAKLEFGTGPQDPLGKIKVLEIVSAQFSVGGFDMDYGEVIHDYLAKK